MDLLSVFEGFQELHGTNLGRRLGTVNTNSSREKDWYIGLSDFEGQPCTDTRVIGVCTGRFRHFHRRTCAGSIHRVNPSLLVSIPARWAFITPVQACGAAHLHRDLGPDGGCQFQSTCFPGFTGYQSGLVQLCKNSCYRLHKKGGIEPHDGLQVNSGYSIPTAMASGKMISCFMA